MSVNSTDKGLLTPGNCAIVFIDHQPRMLDGVESVDRAGLVNSVLALADTARIFAVPVILTAVTSEEFNEETIAPLLELLPGVVPISRSSMNAWDSPEFVSAVKKSGRRNLVIAALWSEVCLVMPALQALTDGYGVYAVEDACGGTTSVAHAAAIRRIEQAGAVSVTAMQVLLEFQRDWSRTARYDEVLSVVRQRYRPLSQCIAPEERGISTSHFHHHTTMSDITTKDGTQIYYKDWGTGPIVAFSHGWPLSSDAFEAQMFFLASNGYRCIAHDRRGHGRSSQPWDGNEMDTYADDLAELFDKLDVKDAVMIGHSTGGGEVARYIGRHGTKRVSKAVLLGAVPPIMLKTEANPGGLPIEVFDGFRQAYLADRAQFFLDVASGPFFGFNRPETKVSQGLIQSWLLQGLMAGHKNAYDCIKAFSETDFTEDLKKFDVPTLIIHGDDDQIVPIGASAMISSKLVKGAVLKIYPGAAHALGDTSKDQLNADLLEFIKS